MFSPFLLRAAGFLLPFYIKAWAISILRHRRQRQEAAALAAAEVAFILLSGQGRGVHNRTPLPHVGNNRRNGDGIGHSCSDRRLLVCSDCARIYGFYQVQDQMTWCLSFSSNQAMFSYLPTPNFDTMQKEDSPSHQTCGTCMEY